jgi:hypothetical protein
LGHKPGNALSVEGLQRKLGPLGFFETDRSAGGAVATLHPLQNRRKISMVNRVFTSAYLW